MEIAVYDSLNAPLWPEALRLYHRAFPHGRKPDAVIRRMFDLGIGRLLLASIDGKLAAMAIAGTVPEGRMLLIDYLAVQEDARGQGIGRRFVHAIKRRAGEQDQLDAVLVEVEADPTPENDGRIRFWERCGFIPTRYVHRYIWVPETYRAMYAPLRPDFEVTDDGQSLFRHIAAFHRISFRPGGADR